MPAAPAPLEINDDWTLEFPIRADAAGQHELVAPFSRLASWSTHERSCHQVFLRHRDLSQTGDVPADFLSPDRRVFLDLGRVMNLAAVTVNGQTLGVLWHPPYRLDITAALKPGANSLEIAVTNTWHNRLIGDEQQPADVTWGRKPRSKEKVRRAYRWPSTPSGFARALPAPRRDGSAS